jgi:hypothetical protein
MKEEIFKEKQRFRDWEVYAILGVLILTLTAKFASDRIFPLGGNPLPLDRYVALMLILGAVLGYFLSLKMSLKITAEHLILKSSPSPWQRRKEKIRWEDIQELELVRFSPTARWSGWNVRFNHGKNYGYCGRAGICVRKKDGKELIIGTRKIDELRAAILKMQGSREF